MVPRNGRGARRTIDDSRLRFEEFVRTDAMLNDTQKELLIAIYESWVCGRRKTANSSAVLPASATSHSSATTHR